MVLVAVLGDRQCEWPSCTISGSVRVTVRVTVREAASVTVREAASVTVHEAASVTVRISDSGHQ